MIKKIYITLLIVFCLGIIPTFINAGFIPHRIGLTANVGGYQMSIDQNINFYTNEIDNVLVQNRYEFVTLGRKNGHLYIYTNGYQGEIYQLYKCIRNGDGIPDPNRAEPGEEGNCVYNSEITIQKLKEIYQTATHWGLSYSVLDYKPGFCIGQFVNLGDEYYCSGPGIITGTSQNYTFTTSDSVQDIANNFTKAPILGGDGSDEIPENGFPSTNRGVFDSYAEQGYVLSRCYSDFSLDNLATATGGIYQFYETELDDGVYYTGATVFDLFDEYGFGNSFDSFFDYWYQTYNESLITDSPAKYVGLSKGLWNMSNKYYYAGLSNKFVDYTKFYNYCSYFVNFGGDWDSEYTGPQLPDDVANRLAPSQSAIDYLSGFIHNQFSSGNNQNFDADTFFTSLTTKFDRLLNNINGSFIGIIPGYILSIMMALIFIRIISH